eukprot:TRINITY_DN2355_c0_g1_i1.p1 TRINITY_DN2355_c0_g1~~TRINITY_DN2355_c0_g1_i1.p1  ORF type:complete len:1543 (-),score=607.78 TRINITY_DN2355_c0_g1_i1:24-4652(-)
MSDTGETPPTTANSLDLVGDFLAEEPALDLVGDFLNEDGEETGGNEDPVEAPSETEGDAEGAVEGEEVEAAVEADTNEGEAEFVAEGDPEVVVERDVEVEKGEEEEVEGGEDVEADSPNTDIPEFDRIPSISVSMQSLRYYTGFQKAGVWNLLGQASPLHQVEKNLLKRKSTINQNNTPEEPPEKRVRKEDGVSPVVSTVDPAIGADSEPLPLDLSPRKKERPSAYPESEDVFAGAHKAVEAGELPPLDAEEEGDGAEEKKEETETEVEGDSTTDDAVAETAEEANVEGVEEEENEKDANETEGEDVGSNSGEEEEHSDAESSDGESETDAVDGGITAPVLTSNTVEEDLTLPAQAEGEFEGEDTSSTPPPISIVEEESHESESTSTPEDQQETEGDEGQSEASEESSTSTSLSAPASRGNAKRNSFQSSKRDTSKRLSLFGRQRGTIEEDSEEHSGTGAEADSEEKSQEVESDTKGHDKKKKKKEKRGKKTSLSLGDDFQEKKKGGLSFLKSPRVKKEKKKEHSREASVDKASEKDHSTAHGKEKKKKLTRKELKEKEKLEKEQEKQRKEKQKELEKTQRLERERQKEAEKEQEKKERLEKEKQKEAEKEQEKKDRIEKEKQKEAEKEQEKKDRIEKEKQKEAEKKDRIEKEKQKEIEKKERKAKKQLMQAEKEKKRLLQAEKAKAANVIFVAFLPTGEKRTVSALADTPLPQTLAKLTSKVSLSLATLVAVDESNELVDLSLTTGDVPGRQVYLKDRIAFERGPQPNEEGTASANDTEQTLVAPSLPVLTSTTLDLSPDPKKLKSKHKQKTKSHRTGRRLQLGLKFTKKHDKKSSQNNKNAKLTKSTKPKKTREELKKEREERKLRQQALLEEEQARANEPSTPKAEGEEEEEGETVTLSFNPNPIVSEESTETLSLSLPSGVEEETVEETLEVVLPEIEDTEEEELTLVSAVELEDLAEEIEEEEQGGEEEDVEFDSSEKQTLTRRPAETISLARIKPAIELVRLKARARSPRDDRVLGWTDIMKNAVQSGLDDSIPAFHDLLVRWMFKLQLSYVRFTWGWTKAYNFKTDNLLRSINMSSEALQIELKVMRLFPIGATGDDVDEDYGHGKTRLTRAKSGGLNVKLDFNYYSTPLPLFPGLNEEEDFHHDPVLHGWEELWHEPIWEESTIVVDSGSRFLKVGISGEPMPRYVLPSIVATSVTNETNYLAGYAALKKATNPQLWNMGPAFDPMDPDWDAALSIWEHTFNNILQVNPEDHPMMFTETPDMSITGREEMMEILFEYFNVPSLYIGNTALMSLYGIGRLNGVVVDIGARMQVIPVNDGNIEQHAVTQLKRGITNVDKYMADLLEENGHYFQSERDIQEVRKMKEKLCYVAGDYGEEMKRNEAEITKTYTLSSGKEISLARERFRCPEVLFHPERLGQLDSSFGLHSMVFDAVMKCPIDTRINLFSNIVLVGGGTLYEGLGHRLEEEIWKRMDSEDMRGSRRSNVACHSPSNRKYLPWTGASIFANMADFETRSVTSDEFYEVGKEMLAESRMYT